MFKLDARAAVKYRVIIPSKLAPIHYLHEARVSGRFDSGVTQQLVKRVRSIANIPLADETRH